MSFSEDITRFTKKTGLSADTVVRKLAFEAFTGVIRKSPVDTGRFRASWRLGLGEVDVSTEPPRPRTAGRKKKKASRKAPRNIRPAERRALENIGAVGISKLRFGITVHITNNLPYARRLENGWSKKQAPGPGGILRLTFDQTVSEFRKVVASVRSIQ